MIRLCVIVALTLGLSSCGLFGSDEPPVKKKSPLQEIEINPAPKKAQIDLLVTASPLINPQPSGEAAPVILRLYQLSGQVPFMQANFRQLWENDAKTLGSTLLHKTQFIVRPGGVQKGVVPLKEGTLLLAATAGFRDFEHAKWRALVALHGNKQVKLKIVLKTRSISLVSHELGQFEETAEQPPAATGADAAADTGAPAKAATPTKAAVTAAAKQAPGDQQQPSSAQAANNEQASTDTNKADSASAASDGQTDRTHAATNPSQATADARQGNDTQQPDAGLAPNPPQASHNDRRHLYLQVGAFSNHDSARQVATRLRDTGIDNVLVDPRASDDAPLYRVRVGPFTNAEHRRAVRQQLLREGLPVISVRQQAQGETR